MAKDATPTTPTTPPQKPRRDWFTFDRSDRWGLGVLLAVVVLLTSIINIVVPIQRWVAGDGIPVPFLSEVTVPELDAVGTPYGVAAYDVTLTEPTVLQRLLDLVPGAILVVLLAVGCWLIIAIMRTIAAGEPFADVNVRRLRVLAMLLLVGPFFTFFAATSAQGALLGDVDVAGLAYAMSLDIPWVWFVAGMVVALLAEAFKSGSQLRDDVDGLV